MNDNQNPNLGNTNGVSAPGAAPNPDTPLGNPNIVPPANTMANPNIVPPTNVAANPNQASEPANPATSAPVAPAVNLDTNLATNGEPVVNQVPGTATVAADPNAALPSTDVNQSPQVAPGMTPDTPTSNPSLPGMETTPNADPNMVTPGIAPAPGGITIDPNAMNGVNAPTAPTPDGGTNPEDNGTKKYDTKTIILVAAAILAVIFAVVYFMFLNPNKKPTAPAPIPNTNENITGNVNENTVPEPESEPEPEPEPEIIDDYDMSWLGKYTNDNVTALIYYGASNDIYLDLSSNNRSSSISLKVNSLTKLTYNDDDFFGDTLDIEIIKTTDGIRIIAECSDEESMFNLDEEFKQEKIGSNDWTGFYEINGGQIIINEIYDNGGIIIITSDNSKYTDYTGTYELKNNKITIKTRSLKKKDTEIKKDGDDLVVTSEDYLAGTYKKVS